MTNKNIINLSDTQTHAYADAFNAFKDLVSQSHGEVDDGVLDALSVVEELTYSFAEQQGMRYTPELLVMFNDKARSIDDYLDMLIDRRIEIVRSAHSDADLREKMLEAGTCFVKTGKAFIKPDRKNKLQVGSGHGGSINQFDERFTPVIEALVGAKINGHEIGFGDLTVLLGEVSDQTMRNQPFDVVQIPKVSMEVAVCNLYGQSLLTSNTLHDPKFYEAYDRPELIAMGLKQVNFSDGWENRLLNAMASDWPDDIAIIDMDAHAKEMARRKKMNLSVAMIGRVMLKHAAAPELGDGELPKIATKTKPPNLNGENWRTLLDALGSGGYRGVDKGMTGSAIKFYFGWDDDDKLKSDIQAMKENDAFTPEPSRIVEQAIALNKKDDLSVAIIGQVMLKHAAAPELGDGELPTQHTKTTPPDLTSVKWNNLLNVLGNRGGRGVDKGMTGLPIKLYFGWDDDGKLKSDIKAMKENDAFTPEPSRTVEQAIALSKKDDLSVAIIGRVMLKHAAAPELGDGELPTQHTKTKPPSFKEEEWRNLLSTPGVRGSRGIEKGMTAPAFKFYFGWDDDDKLKSDIQAIKENDAFTPEPSRTVEQAIALKKDAQNKDDLSVAIIGRVMLKHAAAPELGDGELPTQQTKTKPPELKGEEWHTLLNNLGKRGQRGIEKGMTAPAFKFYFGWDDDDKLKSDIQAIKENDAFTPEPSRTVEQAIALNEDRKKRGKGGHNIELLPPEDFSFS